MIDLTPHERGTVLPVRAHPNARKDGVLGERAGALRVGVTVAPEKGKANAAIAAIAGVLADALDCRGSEVVLLAGESARDKRLLVLGLGPDELRARLSSVIAEA